MTNQPQRIRMARPLPTNGENDCPQCLSPRSVARHNANWTCYKCGFGEVVDDDRELERESSKPNPETFGFETVTGFGDHGNGGWQIEGGEEAYYAAMEAWEKRWIS